MKRQLWVGGLPDWKENLSLAFNFLHYDMLVENLERAGCLLRFSHWLKNNIME